MPLEVSEASVLVDEANVPGAVTAAAPGAI